jgi:hypothetical protein
MMDRQILMIHLIALTGRSASALAAEIGISRSGVTHWLKHGGTSSGIEKQNEILSRLGVYRGTLSPDRVHVWTLKPGWHLASLVRLLSWASSSPFEMVYLAPPSLRIKESLPSDELPLAIYDSEKKIRIIFRRKIDPLNRISEAIDSLVPSGRSKWREPHPVQIDSETFENWMNGNVSVEEYDRILGLWKTTTVEGESSQKAIMENQELAKKLLKLRHQSITSAAKECCLNTSAVASWLKGIPGRLSQEKQNIFLEYLGISVGETPSPHVVHSWEAFCAEMVLRGIRPEEALSIIDRVRKGKS